MDLGELKQKFETLTDDDFVFSVAFNNPHSYRGYYNQVAFEPTHNVSLKEIKESIVVALMNTFIGYKGGEYKYDKFTTVNLAVYSCWETDAEQRLELLVEQMINEYLEADHPTAKLKKARKTAAEKRAEALAEQERKLSVEWAEFSVTYVTKLLTLIHYFMKNGQYSPWYWTVNQTDSGFLFSSLDSRTEIELPLILPEKYSWEIIDAVNSLNRAIEDREYELIEAQRKANLKTAALAKLTKEEQELLGIKG